jgi:hypothetical protein
MSRLPRASNVASPAMDRGWVGVLTRRRGLWEKLTKNRGDEYTIILSPQRLDQLPRNILSEYHAGRERMTDADHFYFLGFITYFISLLFFELFSSVVPLLLLSAFRFAYHTPASCFLFRHEYTKRLLALPSLFCVTFPLLPCVPFLPKICSLGRNDPTTRYE